ncbi:MAG: RNA polymerase factor sigma-32, partial [Alphaproteobacteria bacterium]|nr:RNA polymerase factor sigma-32 [Alphaproteobacteria bacterium]
LTDTPLTLEELSLKLGVSRERVRQIEARTFEKLQDNIIIEAKKAGLVA